MDIVVEPTGWLLWNARRLRCALGKGGVVPAAQKREGDGATPAGRWPLRQVLYRADRIAAPETSLPLSPLSPEDGWCDAPGDPAYNKLVSHPYPQSAEHLWREDEIYDVIVVLGYNDDPVQDGAGSAIFFHLCHTGYRPTEGCVAIPLEAMIRILAEISPETQMEIKGA